MSQHVLTLNRDVEFSISLVSADGTPLVLPAGAQHRFRLYDKPGGTVLMDLVEGAGVTTTRNPARIDIAAAAPSELVACLGTGDLTRTDTGADLQVAWPIRVVPEGTPITGFTGPLTLRIGDGLTIKVSNSPAGPAGPSGPAGGQSVALAVPMLINGGFELWDKGPGPFTSTGGVAPGVRLINGAGATNSLSQAPGLTDDSKLALAWNRSVEGTATSYIEMRCEDVYNLSGRSLAVGFDAKGDGAVSFLVYLIQNFGAGGSPSTSPSLGLVTVATASQRISRTITVPSIAGKTIGAGSFVAVRFHRRITDGNGVLTLDNLALHVGDIDMGYVRPERALERLQADRQFKSGGFQAINGSQYISFGTPMRAAPTVTPSLGTASNITAFGFTHTHTASAAATYTADASL